MGLEFDVAAQLFPNILSIITQLLATLVIFLVAKKYLFKYARDFLAKRKEQMELDLKEANKKNAEAKDYLENAKLELSNARAQAQQLIDNARNEANLQQQKIVEETKEKVQMMMERNNQKMELKKQKLVKDLNKEIVDVAFDVSAKFLKENADLQMQRQSLENILAELKHE